MKEKYEALKMQIIDYKDKKENCNHEWEEPVYDPDLFDGSDRWFITCKLCGKKIMSFDKPDKNKLLNYIKK
jgi:hypothetical protein